MDIKWNCCFKSSEDRTILEDFLPKQQHYRYVVNKFVIKERADILYETKFESDVLVNVCSVPAGRKFKDPKVRKQMVNQWPGGGVRPKCNIC